MENYEVLLNMVKTKYDSLNTDVERDIFLCACHTYFKFNHSIGWFRYNVELEYERSMLMLKHGRSYEDLVESSYPIQHCCHYKFLSKELQDAKTSYNEKSAIQMRKAKGEV